jgi:hypothetical protein
MSPDQQSSPTSRHCPMDCKPIMKFVSSPSRPSLGVTTSIVLGWLVVVISCKRRSRQLKHAPPLLFVVRAEIVQHRPYL